MMMMPATHGLCNSFRILYTLSIPINDSYRYEVSSKGKGIVYTEQLGKK